MYDIARSGMYCLCQGMPLDGNTPQIPKKILPKMSPIQRFSVFFTSYIIHHTSYIIHHTSYIIHHTSYIIHHMNQHFTLWALFSGISLLLIFCKTENNCRELTGRWTNREGQVFFFEPNGKALWLVKFGSQFDSFPVSCVYDCKQKTATLDLTDLKSGPLAGKTLFGIIEWSSDSVFRLDAEPGTSSDARPAAVNPEHAGRFFREE